MSFSRAEPARLVRAALAALAGWCVPGAGHLVLRRWGRGVLFLGLVWLTLGLGCAFHGQLTWVWGGSPLTILRTLGCLGNGLAYFVLQGVGYEGNLRAVGFDYGNAFILTAGLMNLLLVLDAWDIGLGRKE